MKRNHDEQRWSQLMLSAQQGNESDYRQLLQELGVAIASYLRARFGDLHILEDCVQESLMAIHQARNTYEPRHLFRPWLFAIVRYKTIDLLRKKSMHHKIDVLDDEPVDTHQDLEKSLSCGQVLAALSDRHREAIELTKIRGFSIREAATRLKISESAMKVRVHRALDASRKILEQEFRP